MIRGLKQNSPNAEPPSLAAWERQGSRAAQGYTGCTAMPSAATAAHSRRVAPLPTSASASTSSRRARAPPAPAAVGASVATLYNVMGDAGGSAGGSASDSAARKKAKKRSRHVLQLLP